MWPQLHCICEYGYPDNCLNGHDPEIHNPEWTRSQMDTILNAHNPEWIGSPMEAISNGHDPE